MPVEFDKKKIVYETIILFVYIWEVALRQTTVSGEDTESFLKQFKVKYGLFVISTD